MLIGFKLGLLPHRFGGRSQARQRIGPIGQRFRHLQQVMDGGVLVGIVLHDGMKSSAGTSGTWRPF